MDYWKLNEDRRIVALQPIVIRGIYIKQDQVGGIIPEFVQLPGFDVPVWVEDGVTFSGVKNNGVLSTILGRCYIAANCKIGSCVDIADGVTIGTDAEIGDFVTIGKLTSIGNNVIIRDQCEIGSYVKIREYARLFGFCTVGYQSTIKSRVTIYKSVTIGNRVTIGDRTQINDGCVIGNSTVIGDDVTLWSRVKIGNDAYIGERTLIESNVDIHGHINITVGSHIVIGKYYQFIGCGDKGRTLMIYRKHDGETVFSVGCQCGITIDEFKDRVRKACGTSRDSADIYRRMMPMFDHAYSMVSGKPLWMIKLKNIFR